MKDGTYKLNLNEYKSIETHWVAFFANGNSSKYFDTFDVEHIPQQIKRFIDNKNIIIYIIIIQTYDLRCRYFCIGFIDFMFNSENRTSFTNLFSPPNKVILDYILEIKFKHK